MNFMGLREYIEKITEKGILKQVDTEISTEHEIAGVLKALEPTPVMFNTVKESDFRVSL